MTFFLDLTADTGLKADDGLVDTLLAVIDDLVESLYDIQKTELNTEDQRQSNYVLAK